VIDCDLRHTTAARSAASASASAPLVISTPIFRSAKCFFGHWAPATRSSGGKRLGRGLDGRDGRAQQCGHGEAWFFSQEVQLGTGSRGRARQRLGGQVRDRVGDAALGQLLPPGRGV